MARVFLDWQKDELHDLEFFGVFFPPPSLTYKKLLKCNFGNAHCTNKHMGCKEEGRNHIGISQNIIRDIFNLLTWIWKSNLLYAIINGTICKRLCADQGQLTIVCWQIALICYPVATGVLLMAHLKYVFSGLEVPQEWAFLYSNYFLCNKKIIGSSGGVYLIGGYQQKNK